MQEEIIVHIDEMLVDFVQLVIIKRDLVCVIRFFISFSALSPMYIPILTRYWPKKLLFIQQKILICSPARKTFLNHFFLLKWNTHFIRTKEKKD